MGACFSSAAQSPVRVQHNGTSQHEASKPAVVEQSVQACVPDAAQDNDHERASAAEVLQGQLQSKDAELQELQRQVKSLQQAVSSLQRRLSVVAPSSGFPAVPCPGNGENGATERTSVPDEVGES